MAYELARLTCPVDALEPHIDSFFFFSSRRRHTRLTCDWSSDVCSSDLNYRYTAKEIQYVLDNADVVALVHERTFADRVAEALPGAPTVTHTVVIEDETDKRSEEHTSELQSHVNLVCRLLLEKKKKKHKN